MKLADVALALLVALSAEFVKHVQKLTLAEMHMWNWLEIY